jgi:exodeoxyribonuclease I
MTNHQPGFLWHDYETWGTHPALDRPAQFAAIRTDMNLNVIGDPAMFYARPALDMLPQPEACLITGITPQYAYQHGMPEAEFIRTINQLMMQPGTCSAGFNSIRFDDEFTRHTLYRNFYDAYEREWKNGNSRWDLIDVVRLCGALRPEGINWPVDENGLPAYRLEMLTAANHIEQKGAHDALVDVRATIDVARLVLQKQPKLFEYALGMRDKQVVAKAIGIGTLKPVLHISGMFGSKNYCASIVLPLCMHPTNKNAVICFDLRESPAEFLQLSVAEIRQRLFASWEDLAGNSRIPLKNIHLNKCPMVAPASMVTPEVAQRIQIDLSRVREHYDALMLNQTACMKAQAVFEEQGFVAKTDPDAMLYSGGFFSNADKAAMHRVCKSKPEELKQHNFIFEDARLAEMLFRYKARNYPEILTEEEALQWQEFRFQRLTNPEYGATITMEAYQEKLETLYQQYEDDEEKALIISLLMEWGDSLLSIQ